MHGKVTYEQGRGFPVISYPVLVIAFVPPNGALWRIGLDRIFQVLLHV